MNNITSLTFKRALSLLLTVAMLCGITMLASCQSEPLVIKDSDTYIVIKTTEKALNGKEDMVLLDYMAILKESGDLEYAISNGMITSINGIDNPADFSSCWMLYTSDTDNASPAWGTVEYEGNEYGSAVVGAELLKVKPDHLYIWVFKPFN